MSDLAILAKSLFDLVTNAPGDEVTLKKADNHWAGIPSPPVTCHGLEAEGRFLIRAEIQADRVGKQRIDDAFDRTAGGRL